MNEDAIVTAAEALKTALEGNGLGEIYDHIPSKASYPCVVIAPNSPFIDEPENEAYTKLQANFDLWVIGVPGSDNKSIQHSLYKSIAKTINALDAAGDTFIFSEASEPQPIENNQAKALASYIAVSVEL